VSGGLRSLAELSLRQARRLVILVTGATVLALGLVMVVLPGPAVLVIPAGLAILAVEFVWARRLLCRVKRMVNQGLRAVGGKEHPPDATCERLLRGEADEEP
jgi:tellurite resistance protein TerC